MTQNITTELVELVTPNMANFSGKMHGGELLKLLDKAAYAAAMRYSGCYTVTMSVNDVVFKKPIFIGELVRCIANVNHTGNTSMEIGIKVMAENIKTKEVRHTHTCYFTMVCVDDEGKPTPVEKLELVTEKQQRRWNKALKRKEARKVLAQMMREIEES